MCICCKCDDNKTFCDFCYPDTCYNCSVSHVYIENNQVKCSHGCSLELMDYVRRKIFTIFLNRSVRDKVRVMGSKIEIIIEEGTDVKVSDKPIVEEGKVTGVHYSNDTERILEEGFSYDKASSSYGVRDNAAYAFVSELWERPMVYLTAPEEKTHISSYTMVDFVGEGEYQIPPDKYDEKLILSPKEFKENIDINPFYCLEDLYF